MFMYYHLEYMNSVLALLKYRTVAYVVNISSTELPT